MEHINNTLESVTWPVTWPVTWVVTEGMAGTENQCLGVADALGVTPVVHRIGLHFPWNFLSPWLGLECAATFVPKLQGPWPDLLLASGRKSIAASRYIKRMSGGKTFTVQIQDPRTSPAQFDMVAVPAHDPTRGENVLVTTATPNRITAATLARAREEFAPLFEKIGTPRVAVLIGGSTKSHTFTLDEAHDLAAILAPIPNLMITTSRRTGAEKDNLFRYTLGTQGNYLWNGQNQNPYQGILAWADYILVTADSTAMISDAATTGKPVYILPMAGLSRRQSLLIDNLKKYGAVQDFGGKLESWTYPPLTDSMAIADFIRKKSGLF